MLRKEFFYPILTKIMDFFFMLNIKFHILYKQNLPEVPIHAGMQRNMMS